MSRRLAVAAVALGIAAALGSARTARADEGAPIARARIEVETPVVAGHPVPLVLEVLVPTWFRGAPRFPSIDLDDAVVVSLLSGGNFSAEVGGETYSGVSRDYLIYPQVAGTFTLPPLEIVAEFKIGGRPSGPTPVRVTPLTFEAIVPPGAADLPFVLVTPSLSMTQTLDPEPSGLRVGDALRRRVEIEAEGSLAMLLPPLRFEAPSGTALYSDPPALEDAGGERGEARVARRVETWTYVFEEPGVYTLPPAEIPWWNLTHERVERGSVPAVELTVAANETLRDEIPLDDATGVGEPASTGPPVPPWWRALRPRLPYLVGALAFLGVAVRAARRWGPSIRERRERLARERADSEESYLEELHRATGSGEPVAVVRALFRWLDRRAGAEPAGGTATAKRFVEAAGDDELARELAALGAELYGRPDAGPGREGPSWSGDRLFRALRSARARALDARRPARDGVPGELPPINPGRRARPT